MQTVAIRLGGDRTVERGARSWGAYSGIVARSLTRGRGARLTPRFAKNFFFEVAEALLVATMPQLSFDRIDLVLHAGDVSFELGAYRFEFLAHSLTGNFPHFIFRRQLLDFVFDEVDGFKNVLGRP